MTCKYRHGDWCHEPKGVEEYGQELCYSFCYGKEEDCPLYDSMDLTYKLINDCEKKEDLVDSLKRTIMMKDKEIEEVEDILLDNLIQSCGEEDIDGWEIDNRCMSPFEHATKYLHRKGLLERKNDRIYYVSKEGFKRREWLK